MDKQGTNSARRRTFLKVTGSLATAGLAGLAGCSGGGDGGDTDTTTTSSDGGSGDSTTVDADAEDLREEYELDELDYELEDELNIFQWSDYWGEDIVPTFEKVFGVSVNVSNFASNEEMFNKLQAGGTAQYDLVFPSDYMIGTMAEQGVIQELDREKIPNYENLDSLFSEPSYDPDPGTYSVPYQWGTSGIGWTTEMLDDTELRSWDAMWSDEYAGEMTMMNDMRETIGAALKRRGYSLNTTDPEKIEEAKQDLIEQKELLLTYDSSNFEVKLINEQASPVHGWSGDIFRAYWETYEDDSSPVNYRVPDEGGVVWVDNGAVTADAPHPNAAHAFINYYSNARVAAAITNWTYFGSPNAAAEEYIYDEILDDPAIYPSDEVMDSLEYIENVGDARSYYSEAWTEIQNA
ncbi:MAG: extracellular solute-binding protein [Halobacteriota archaeon]